MTSPKIGPATNQASAPKSKQKGEHPTNPHDSGKTSEADRADLKTAHQRAS